MSLPERANRQFLFVDMNSFFTSCEQAENPALRGKPVIVIPTKGSCALAASYEAKAFGIRTGTLEKEARFLCPRVLAVPARPKLYMAYHEHLTKILKNLTPNVTMRSVDEGSIRLCRNEEPWELGDQIKAAIWREMDSVINCSIGIGPNLFLSKLATELQKPNGLVEIRLENLTDIYQRVQLRDLCGISYAMERQLNRVGIFSVLDFYQAKATDLRQWFGINGYRWWLQLHGYQSYEHLRPRQSVSHSHVLPPAYRSPESAYATLQRLVAKVGRRLRREGYAAGRISLYVRFIDKVSTGVGFRITPASDTMTLLDHIRLLWRQIDPKTPVLHLGVWVNDLQTLNGLPMPLFPADQKRISLARAIDRINDDYGADTIRFAVVDQPSSRAPDRISFNALFKIEHE